MNILVILKIICAVLTIFVGAVSVIKPTSIFDFTGLQAAGPRGITEIRSIVGAVFIGLGLAPFLLGLSPAAFEAGGITYLTVALVRLVSIFIDKSGMRSNWISLISEIVLGAILLL